MGYMGMASGLGFHGLGLGFFFFLGINFWGLGLLIRMMLRRPFMIHFLDTLRHYCNASFEYCAQPHNDSGLPDPVIISSFVIRGL